MEKKDTTNTFSPRGHFEKWKSHGTSAALPVLR